MDKRCGKDNYFYEQGKTVGFKEGYFKAMDDLGFKNMCDSCGRISTIIVDKQDFKKEWQK